MKLQSYFLFSLKVINGIYSGVTTVELDNLAAETGERSVDYKKLYSALCMWVPVVSICKINQNKNLSNS